MKRPDITVTIKENGRQAKLIGYDRDRYYEVQYLDDGSKGEMKVWRFELDIHPLLGLRGRYKLNPTGLNLSNKELWKDYKHHTRGNFSQESFRVFTFFVLNNGEDGNYYHDLKLYQLKKKVLQALQSKQSFRILVNHYYKNGSSFYHLLDYVYETNEYDSSVAAHYSRSHFNAERNVLKWISKFLGGLKIG